MAAPVICAHNKFGFCKYKETCRNQHINDSCENCSCDVSRCNLRHPKKCKFYTEYKRCKFNPCAYLHVESDDVSNAEILRKLEEMSKNASEKDDIIKELVKRVRELEQIITKKEETETVENVETVEIDETVENDESVDNDETVATDENVETVPEKFKCSKCKFETIHENGLKIHIKRKHAKDSETCDLCDESFESAREMRMHRTTHSYHSKTEKHHKCEECDFTSTTIETMEVHIGKCCYNYFECGLCEDRFESLEKLELHLKTCEIYECGKCYIRFKSLSEVKKHIEKEHEVEQSLHHLKMDRSDESKVVFKHYTIDQV